mmetsp:Transcript_27341/g.35854  ORF Transcript_27341/g.35854 Transcript_27341/m.35854 type:complete len:219 (-) Transcript_27341:192-848(-)|eukprot:CAMPEP_0117745186 /NCGR_PEP_ID=MMETSP0947-20121206/7205_1 /TAXON_ID=44440 /ORGANISM="Chattonella subsalsa, Strain CCMP2191" /LENGTH=218 /DNA_ID=CAMNT_0005562279 /DNA_START=52 /DNA_END=708 /DNA_ORIENTATION=-
MGIDLACFVHPERISSQLLCTICHEVLDKPVQTPCEHLFCEDELLEWLMRKETCPVDQVIINPDEITKASRIVVNMLGELERYCPFKEQGCEWTGASERLQVHLDEICKYQKQVSNEEALIQKDAEIAHLLSEIAQRDSRITKMEDKLEKYSREIVSLRRKVTALEGVVYGEDTQRYRSHQNEDLYLTSDDEEDVTVPVSDLQRLNILRQTEAVLQQR